MKKTFTLLMLLLTSICYQLHAQSYAIQANSATYIANNGLTANGQISFAIQNTSTLPIRVDSIACAIYSGTGTYSLWYHPNLTAAIPTATNTANGWIQQIVTGPAVTNPTSGNIVTVFPTTNSLTIPAGATYRFAIVSVLPNNIGVRYRSWVAADPRLFTTDSINVLVNTNTAPLVTGYGGTFPNWSNTPRVFVGNVWVTKVIPSSPTVLTGTNTLITNSSARLSSSVVSNGANLITTSGIVLSPFPSPTRGSFGVIDLATTTPVQNGNFTLNATGLTNSTTYYYRAYAENAIGTSYGVDSIFTTNASAVLPTITKTTPLNIQAYSATVGGSIISDGGSPITASGVVYSTTPNPALLGFGVVDSTTNPAVTTGSFSVNPSGLTHSTKYYYRAYATNSVGTAYSTVDSFTTAPVVSILPYYQNFDTTMNSGWTSTIVGGTLNDWQLGSPNKTFLSAAFSAPNAWVTKLSGNYSTNHNAALESPQLDFTNYSANPVLRFKHKFITESCCDGGMLEISINGGAWTKVENAIGTGANFNTPNGTAWYNSAAQTNTWGNNSTAFSTAVNGWITSSIALPGAGGQPNVKIRFRFVSDVSIENDGWMIDDIEVFAPSAPTVSTGTHTNVTTSNATLFGNITNNGGNAITASGIVIGTSPSPTRGGFGVIDSATNPLVLSGAFSLNVTGLTPATTYYYRSYAVNSVGTSYGTDSTFTTNASAVIPTVLRLAATNVQAYSATVGGNITSNGGDPVFASGVVYSTNPNPVLFGFGVVDSTTNPAVTTGSFSVNPSGLTHSTKYYYRAYATNSVGTAYSVEDSFTTAPVVSILPYYQNFDTTMNSGWTSTIVGGTLNDWQLGSPNKTFLSAAFSAPNAWVTKLSGNYSTNHNAALESPQLDFTNYSANPVLRFKHKFITESCCDGGMLEISINGGAWTKVENAIGTGANFNTPNGTAWYNSAAQTNTWGNNSTAFSTAVNGWITSSIALPGAGGQPNVKIRFRFVSDVSVENDGWMIDDIEVFAPSAPTVLTGSYTNLTTSNITIIGNITNNGGNTVTASGIVLSTSPNPTRGAFGVIDSATNPVAVTGAFSLNIAGLFPSTTYYYRAYAVNALGTSYGVDSTFTTPATAVVPTVVRIAASNTQAYSATVGGNITSNGGDPVTASGIVYSTTPNPTLLGFGVIDSATTPVVAIGGFNINLAGLTHSTKYYFRAYATNNVGTAYSVEDSFVTSPVINTLPYSQNFDAPGNTGWKSTIVGGTINNWVLGTPAKTFLNGAFSAPNAWVTKLTGDYDNSQNAAVESPQFDFSTYTTTPVLRFKHKFVSESGWDALVVEISTNGGTTWTKLDDVLGTGTNFNTPQSYSWYNNTSTAGPINTPNKFSGDPGSVNYSSQTNGWIESATILTGTAGQSNVKVRFRFGTDGSGIREGWAIDDIEVVEVTTPTTAASNVTVTPSATSATVNFTAGNGQGRMVVARLSSTLAVAPTNNTLYGASAAFGSANTTGTGNFIVYMGNGTSVNVTGLTQLTGYTFDVYEYNGKYMHNSFAGAISSNTTTTPVKLVSLKATKVNNDVLVSWSTASEVNNRGFNVERSIDGKTFEYVGFVKGAGNSSVSNNYRLEDANAFVTTGVSKLYYRLKQMDNDGKFEYSKVVTVENNERKVETVITYPNPFSDKVTVALQNVNAGTVKVEVLDISGRLVTTVEEIVSQGTQTITVNGLSGLTQGVYMVRVTASGVTQTSKLIKQ